MDDLRERAVVKMAGNAMSVPCVGAFICAAVMALDVQYNSTKIQDFSSISNSNIRTCKIHRLNEQPMSKEAHASKKQWSDFVLDFGRSNVQPLRVVKSWILLALQTLHSVARLATSVG